MCPEIRGSNRQSLNRDLQPGEKILSSNSLTYRHTLFELNKWEKVKKWRDGSIY